MIEYEPGAWAIGFAFSLKGSVFPRASTAALPCSFITMILSQALKLDCCAHFKDEAGNLGAGLLNGFSFILGFLIVFRSQKAYARWWEGGTLLQQLRGEWFNAFSSLLAFCNVDPQKKDDVEQFQHQLVRLVSMLYGSALKQVSAMQDNAFEFIDIDGFDLDALEYMHQSHDSCEVTLQWIQRLIVEANGKDIIKIAPPILARVYNQLGNGIVKLNNARKIHDFPIPFPLAQVITIMLLVQWFVTAAVCAVEVEDTLYAGSLAFVVVLSYWSINYIAVELEQPFGDDPNDLPLHEMQVDLNKSLCALLEPRAASPPGFKFHKERHTNLYRKKLPVDEAIAELRGTDRDTYSTQRKAGMTKTEQLPVDLIHASRDVKSPSLKNFQPHSDGLSKAVDNCFDGSCDMGSATEGSCADTEYRDSMATSYARDTHSKIDANTRTTPVRLKPVREHDDSVGGRSAESNGILGKNCPSGYSAHTKYIPVDRSPLECSGEGPSFKI